MSPANAVASEQQGAGSSLRQAREAAGLAIAEVAAKMRVPIRVVETIESGNWEQLGAPVFVRGKLRSYARAIGLPEEDLPPAAGLPPVAPPVLQPRTYTPRYQRIAEQAAKRMVYVVITATLAIPVWMVTRGHIESTPAEVASLEPAVEPGAPGSAPGTGQARQQQPFVSSMTPIQSRQSRRPQPAESAANAAGSPALSLRFRGDSWMEVSARDGSQVEQALVRAGEERIYGAGEIGQVVLGNAEAVEVARFGKVQDLEPFQRANVARFTVSSDGSLAPVTD